MPAKDGPALNRRTVLASTLALAACGRGAEASGSGDVQATLDGFARRASALPPVPQIPRTNPPPALRGLSDLPIGTCFLPDKVGDAGFVDLMGALRSGAGAFSFNFDGTYTNVAQVPEPGTLALLGSGLLLLGAAAGRGKRRAS